MLQLDCRDLILNGDFWPRSWRSFLQAWLAEINKHREDRAHDSGRCGGEHGRRMRRDLWAGGSAVSLS